MGNGLSAFCGGEIPKRPKWPKWLSLKANASPGPELPPPPFSGQAEYHQIVLSWEMGGRTKPQKSLWPSLMCWIPNGGKQGNISLKFSDVCFLWTRNDSATFFAQVFECVCCVCVCSPKECQKANRRDNNDHNCNNNNKIASQENQVTVMVIV